MTGLSAVASDSARLVIEQLRHIPGLGVVSPDVAGKDIITNNLIAINADTVDGLADLGL